MLSTIHVTHDEHAAMVVVLTAYVATEFAPAAEPALKPYQPIHKNAPPIIANGLSSSHADQRHSSLARSRPVSCKVRTRYAAETHRDA